MQTIKYVVNFLDSFDGSWYQFAHTETLQTYQSLPMPVHHKPFLLVGLAECLPRATTPSSARRVTSYTCPPLDLPKELLVRA